MKWCEGLSDQINVTEAGGTIVSWPYITIGSSRYPVVPWLSEIVVGTWYIA